MDELSRLAGVQGEALEAALGRLAPRRRQAVVLRFGEGLSLPKVAHAMGISTPAAHQLSTLGLAQLIRTNPALTRRDGWVPGTAPRWEAEDGVPPLTMQNLKRARRIFMEKERRDIYYRAALTLIEAARRAGGSWALLDVAEGTGILLQNWNKTRYRFRKGGFGNADVDQIRGLLEKHERVLGHFRRRQLPSFSEADEAAVGLIFFDFEIALGPVGAAKVLHLLAPEFFPIWDRKIASKGYDLSLARTGMNAGRYLALMHRTRAQIEYLGGWDKFDTNPLKLIDEFNYCVHTTGWMT